MAISDSKETYNNYMRVYHLKRYYKLKQAGIDKLGGSCCECHSEQNLQFHHVERSTKKFNVSMMLNVSLKKFWEEVAKCVLLCVKCHQEKTTSDLGKKKAIGTHGTLSSYRYCHCEICKEAKNKWTVAYRKRKPLT